MAIEHCRSPSRTLFVAAVLALACGISSGCETIPLKPRTIGSIRVTGDGMYEAVLRWRENAPPEDRAAIDELIGRKDVQIHVFLVRGKLSKLSRAGESILASNEEAEAMCPAHLKVEGVPWEQDWDVIYDQERAEEFEERYGIPTPLDVHLQHELLGHVRPPLQDPKLLDSLLKDQQLKLANECAAVEMENRYRKRTGLPVVRPELVGCPPR